LSDRPVPALRGEERLYFEGARNHQLIFQTCETCSSHVWYPRAVCPQCMGTHLLPTVSAGHGWVYSFTTLHRAGHPSRHDDVPYTIGLIDLDEGIRVIGDVISADPREVHIGLPVTATFSAITPAFAVPAFKPSRESDGRNHAR
jgi:uncharacterized protein